MQLFIQVQAPAGDVATRGLADREIFGVGILHIAFLAVVVLLLLTGLFMFLRRRAMGSRRVETGHDNPPPEIHSTR